MCMFTLAESTRWLLRQNRPEDAWRSLTWIRASSSPIVTAEFHEMQQNIAAEARLREGLGWRELLTRPNQKRFALGSLTFLFQQGTGSTALAFFGPQFFQKLVGDGEKDLLITGLFGAVKVVACSIFILFVAESFGRRALMSGMFPLLLLQTYAKAARRCRRDGNVHAHHQPHISLPSATAGDIQIRCIVRPGHGGARISQHRSL